MHRFIFFALLLASSAYASDDPCICPDVYEPVCGYDNKTYSNACQARCNGVGVKMEGECGCTCYYLVYAPVCGKDGITYDGPCEAQCTTNLKPEDWVDGECQRPQGRANDNDVQTTNTCSCSMKYPWEKGTQGECSKRCGSVSVLASIEMF